MTNADRAQHHDPDQALGDLHHRRRQPAVGGDQGRPGRAPDVGAEPAARQLRADRPPAGAARRAEDRGHLRHRRQRHRARRPPRTRRSGKEQSMTISGGSALSKDEIDRMVKEAEQYAAEDAAAPRGGRGPQPGRPARLHDREVPRRQRRQDPRGRQDRGPGRRRRAQGHAGERRGDQPRRSTPASPSSTSPARRWARRCTPPPRPTPRPPAARTGATGEADDDVVDAEIVDEGPADEAGDGRPPTRPPSEAK